MASCGSPPAHVHVTSCRCRCTVSHCEAVLPREAAPSTPQGSVTRWRQRKAAPPPAAALG